MNNGVDTVKIHISSDAYRQVFACPMQVVTNHIKLAGALQLKVLLWICSHGGEADDYDVVAKELGASVTDVKDAMQYWLVNGILQSDSAPVQKSAEPLTLAKPQPVSKSPSNQKPTRSEVAKRGSESPEVSFLLCEAQQKFNRSLSQNEMSTLVWMMDTLGLTADVILMAIGYAVSIDKCNMRYIEKLCVSWCQEEINTIEKAEAYLTEAEQCRQDWHRICRLFGLEIRKPSQAEETYVNRWLNEWRLKNEMLTAAYNECIDHTGKMSFQYINKVLSTWHEEGYQKPEDIPKQKPANSGSKLRRSSEKAKETSYDINEIESFLLDS